MKRINCIFLLIVGIWVNTGNTGAQVTIFPDVDKVTGSQPVQIIRVDLTHSYTILDCYFMPRQEGAWICINKNFYISPSGFDDRKYLIMAKDINICPKMTKVVSAANDLRFQLYFPPLEKGIFKIDAIESKTGLNFLGVHINNNGGVPAFTASDSVSPARMARLFSGSTRLTDSLEGIWERKITRAHYSGQQVLIDEYTDVPDTVFIINRNNEYRIYDQDGKGLAETITKLTGNIGFFYKEQLFEVNAAGSGYLEFTGENSFTVSFSLPLRLARYIALGDFLDSDNLIETKEFRKLNGKEIGQLIEKRHLK